MAQLKKLPAGYIQCQWCQGGVRVGEDGRASGTCPHCGLYPQSAVDKTVGGKVDPARAQKSQRNRKGAPRMKEFVQEPAGTPVLGVDPGAKYTAVVLRDGDWLGYSSTLVCPDGVEPIDWMKMCVEEIRFIMLQHCPATTKVAIEGVSAPKGFKNGQRASINPKYIVFTAVVFGGVVNAFGAHVVPPGGNGSQNVTHYPPPLVGRRPEDLPGSTNGAGTRDHEQSAWDVAGKATADLWPRAVPDFRRLMEEKKQQHLDQSA